MNPIAQKQVDAYLARLRQRLRGLTPTEADEIVAELRAHIEEKIAGMRTPSESVKSILAALGTPEALAREYMTSELLARAQVSRSPMRVLQGVFHLASLSFLGFVVFFATVVGYYLGGVFLFAALAKLINPQTAGLWVVPNGSDIEYSLRLGFVGPPGAGREVLGWWIVPLGLLLGCALLVLTTRCALWAVRQYRQSQVLPGGAR